VARRYERVEARTRRVDERGAMRDARRCGQDAAPLPVRHASPPDTPVIAPILSIVIERH